MSALPKWRFTVTADDDDASSTETLGLAEGRNDTEAFMRGVQCYVIPGLNASHYAARSFGGTEGEYPEAFFSVVEVDADEEKSVL